MRYTQCDSLWYNLASNQFTGLNAVTVPGTLRDSLNLLAVVLEQETELNPTEIMTDTAGYTDTVFGIFHLLGYQFSPRIADIGGARFWRVDSKADYGVLDDLAANKINVRLIAEHWDDLLRLAGSLKLGVVRAAGITRTLQTNDRPTKLARALQELGASRRRSTCCASSTTKATGAASSSSSIAVRAATSSRAPSSTASAANYASATAKARKISSARSVSSSISSCCGTRSTWTPRSISFAPKASRPARGRRRLSPLGFKHINMLGRYAFTLPDMVARGELRPLRNPNASGPDEL